MFGSYLSIVEDKAVETSLVILIPAIGWRGCRYRRFVGHFYWKRACRPRLVAPIAIFPLHKSNGTAFSVSNDEVRWRIKQLKQ
jgi:hypothetical protein